MDNKIIDELLKRIDSEIENLNEKIDIDTKSNFDSEELKKSTNEDLAICRERLAKVQKNRAEVANIFNTIDKYNSDYESKLKEVDFHVNELSKNLYDIQIDLKNHINYAQNALDITTKRLEEDKVASLKESSITISNARFSYLQSKPAIKHEYDEKVKLLSIVISQIGKEYNLDTNIDVEKIIAERENEDHKQNAIAVKPKRNRIVQWVIDQVQKIKERSKEKKEQKEAKKLEKINKNNIQATKNNPEYEPSLDEVINNSIIKEETYNNNPENSVQNSMNEQENGHDEFVDKISFLNEVNKNGVIKRYYANGKVETYNDAEKYYKAVQEHKDVAPDTITTDYDYLDSVKSAELASNQEYRPITNEQQFEYKIEINKDNGESQER